MSCEPVIVLQALSKFYKIYPGSRARMLEAFDPRGRDRHRKFHVLKNIDLTVLEGEIVGIIGRNGCGKSTLLKIVAGLLNSSSGTMTVNGSVAPVSEIGSGLNPELTGRENIAFRVQLSALSGSAAVDRIEDIVEFAELAEFLDQPVKTYSSGMAARLGFAIAAFSDAQILLLDEVLAVGDLRFRRKCFDLLNAHIDEGKTVLLVSHDTQAILQFCSRALVLEQGEIAAMGSPKAAIEVYERLLFENQTPKKTLQLTDSKSCVMNPDAKAVNTATAVFKNAYLEDQQGQVSHKLTQGERYTFHFDIVFNAPCTDVSFGAQIRLPTGFIVSGANLLDHEGNRISAARTGDIIHASWSFECLLVPGGYCMRAFVTGADSAQTALVDDIVLFEVDAVEKQNGGVVTLNQTVEYILHTAN